MDVTTQQPQPATGKATVDLPVRAPFPWDALLGHLGARLVPSRERVRDRTYVREVPAERGTVEARYDVGRSVLAVRASGRVDPTRAAERIARLFATAHTPESVAELAADRIIGPRIAIRPGLRPLGCWDPFELCVRTLVGQQVSVAAAQTLIARLAERCGAIEPEPLARTPLDRIGMPGRRVAAIQRFAAAVGAGELELDGPWPQLERALAQQPGFGPWTRAYLGIRLGRDADAFPAADVGLQRAAGATSAKALEALAERWRPWRAYAATYLWMVAPVAAHARR